MTFEFFVYFVFRVFCVFCVWTKVKSISVRSAAMWTARDSQDMEPFVGASGLGIAETAKSSLKNVPWRNVPHCDKNKKEADVLQQPHIGFCNASMAAAVFCRRFILYKIAQTIVRMKNRATLPSIRNRHLQESNG